MNDIIIILNQLKDIAFSVVNTKLIIIIISSILGACLGLYVVWFAIRKLISSIKGAMVGKLVVGSEAHRNYYKKHLGWDDEDYNDNFNQW